MYCRNCGRPLTEKEKYCPTCGKSTSTESNKIESSNQKGKSDLSLLLGIISCVCFWNPILSFPLALISIITGIHAKKENNQKTIGPILGGISILLTLIEITLITLFGWYIIHHVTEETEIEKNDWDQFYETFEHWKESFDISGYSWLGDDQSILYLNYDKSYIWYQSDLDHEDNFTTGTYTFYTAETAINYIANNLKEYEITEEAQKELFQDGKYSIQDYYLIILNEKKSIIEGKEQQTNIMYYYGFYNKNKKCLELVNMNTNSPVVLTIKEKLNKIDL